jgi:hypothetical protein
MVCFLSRLIYLDVMLDVAGVVLLARFGDLLRGWR